MDFLREDHSGSFQEMNDTEEIALTVNTGGHTANTSSRGSGETGSVHVIGEIHNNLHNMSQFQEFRTEAVTEPEFNECTDSIYKYLTVILGSLLGVSLVVLFILISFIWKQYYRRDRGKKVSRAESWRYESSIYINPGRHKSGIPVYTPSPTLPLTAPLSLASPGDQDPGIDTFQHRMSRSFNTEIIPEERSNFNTLERLSNEGSTRAASPQQTPLLYRRETPGTTPVGTPQISPHLNRSRHPSANMGSGYQLRAGSMTAVTGGWPRTTTTGHRRNSSLSALRGVDIIRCTTPLSRNTPSPSPGPRGEVMTRQDSIDAVCD